MTSGGVVRGGKPSDSMEVILGVCCPPVQPRKPGKGSRLLFVSLLPILLSPPRETTKNDLGDRLALKGQGTGDQWSTYASSPSHHNTRSKHYL